MEIQEIGRLREVLNAYGCIYGIDVVDIHMIPEYLRKKILEQGVVWKS